MITIDKQEELEELLKAALVREDGLRNHNFLLLRELKDIKDKRNEAVNALADTERKLEKKIKEIESLRALYER